MLSAAPGASGHHRFLTVEAVIANFNVHVQRF